jgi:hypothetical protein
MKKRVDKMGSQEIDTGSGTMKAFTYKVPEIISLDFNIQAFDFDISVYDTPIKKGEYVGYVGVDFFKDKKICLDLLNKTLDIT